MNRIYEVTGDTVSLERYMLLNEIACKYRDLIEENIDTSGLNKEIYPDLPAVVVYERG